VNKHGEIVVCERCGKGEAKYRVESGIIDLVVCIECAALAQVIAAFRPLGGDRLIVTPWQIDFEYEVMGHA